jgi:peptidoglycan DL-endopeptidase CwlO
MRMRFLIPLAGAVALTAVCVGAGIAQPPRLKVTPAIRAKQTEANRVLKEIAAIDESLNAVSEQYDGARVRLAALRKDLAIEQGELARAKVRYRKAQARGARLAVWLYTSNRASSLDVILGATSLTQMLRLSDAEDAISRQAATIANQTAKAKEQLQLRVRLLDRDRAAARSTVKELAARRATILRGLAERRRLLASVQAEVNKLEAQERARQERLAAAARARLKAELAARAKAEAEARAKAEAEARAAAKAKAAAAAKAREAASAEAVTAGTSPSDPAQVTQTPDSSSAVPLSSDPSPVDSSATETPGTDPAPVAPPAIDPATGLPIGDVGAAGTGSSTTFEEPLPAGHPEAAQVALQYLGVPYLWGGSTPDGFDCSGLVAYVYAQLGMGLPHFAAAQWGLGVPVPVTELQPGDLVFFDALDHVGIYLGDGEFVDAPHTGSFVRIDTLTEPWYAKHFVGARRI